MNDCSNLKNIHVPNDLVLPQNQAVTRGRFLVSDPETFFKTAEARTIFFVGDHIPMTDEDMAYAWLFQSGKKWRELIQKRMKNPSEVLRFFAEIYRKDSSLPAPKVKVIKEYLEFYSDVLDDAAIHRFLKELCVTCPAIAGKLEKENLLAECSAAESRCVHPIETLVDQCYAQPNEYRETVEKVVKSGLPYADGSGTSSKKAVIVFLEQYMAQWFRCSGITSGPMGNRRDLKDVSMFEAPADADQIAAALDRSSLSNFLLSLIRGRDYRNYILPFVRYATEEDATQAIAEITKKKKGNAKDRYWAENMIKALYLSDTNAVTLFIEKDKSCDFAKYLKMRGMTLQVYRDSRSLPQWPMDEKGVIQSAFGRLTYALKDDFKLQAMEGDKQLRSVSAKTYPQEAEEFKKLKTETAEFYKKRLEYVRSIYIVAEKIAIDHWMQSYGNNPVLRPVTEKVIWADAAGETFMMSGGVIHTADGKAYEPKESVQIAHVLEMSAQQINAWQLHLKKNKKTLLIEQVWEPIATIQDVESFTDMVLSKEERNEFKRVLGRKSIAVKSESDDVEFDHRAYQYIYSDTGTMTVGDVLRIRYEIDQDAGETTLQKFTYQQKLNRQLNSVLYELGRVCVKSAIRQNRGDMLSALLKDNFTAAQIMEFIRIAQELASREAIGILLEYKQTHFADFDPMAEFVLE